jgi:hypothetical protein
LAKNAKSGAPLRVGNADEIKSLGHPSKKREKWGTLRFDE